MSDETRTPPAEPTLHQWAHAGELGNWEYCRACLVIRRADDENPPCSGPARVTLRQADWFRERG